jgi:hypothetical protein
MLMDYLKNNNIRISKHNWQEEGWDLRVIGPSIMPVDCATKLVSKGCKTPGQVPNSFEVLNYSNSGEAQSLETANNNVCVWN